MHKWLVSIMRSRIPLVGLLVVAMLACSIPITHADHTDINHGHHHGDMAADITEGDFSGKKTSQDERSSHQHVGMSEHNPGFLSYALVGFHPNLSSERWRITKLRQPRQDFLYALERPPRA